MCFHKVTAQNLNNMNDLCEKLAITNVRDACRVCMRQGDDMFSLHDTTDSLEYGFLLTQCTNVSNNEALGDYKLPERICLQCANELKITYHFLMKVKRGRERLQAMLIEINFSKEIESTIPHNDDDMPSVKTEPEEIKEDFVLVEISHDESRSKAEIKEELWKDCSFKKTRRGKGSKSTSLWQRSEKKIKKDNEHKCKLCIKIFPSKSALILHTRCHTKEKPFKCSVCEETFAAKGNLDKHFSRLHTNSERKCICEYCSKGFFTNKDLKAHVRIHTGETPYSCKLCNKSFNQSGTLKVHKKIHTGERPFSCGQCPKSFINRQSLKRHSLVHSNTRNFICNLCGMALKSKSALSNHHIAIHTEERKYVCELCGMKYSIQCGLLSHKKRCHSEKSGVCEVCKMFFPNVDEHLRLVHTRKGIYQCDLCQKVFLTKSSVSSHITHVHAENHKFKCTYDACVKRFPNVTLLEFHVMKQHTHISPFPCGHCEHLCYRAGDLAKHMKMKHHIE